LPLFAKEGDFSPFGLLIPANGGAKGGEEGFYKTMTLF
jgi:hypothetical protein